VRRPLKNAIDVGSRPYGKSLGPAKPVVGVSPGASGGFGANRRLRQSRVFLNVPAMAQPEASIGGADKLFAEDASISNPATREFMTRYLAAFGRGSRTTPPDLPGPRAGPNFGHEPRA
jgi:chromate reductase